MRDEDHRPGASDADARQVHDDVESVLRHEGVEQDTQQTERRGDDDAAVGHVVLVEASRVARPLAHERHRTQRATGRVEAGVQRGERRGQDNHLHDVTRVGNADAGEERREGGLIRRVGVVGQRQCEEDDGANVEEENTDDHRVDGLGQDCCGILRLTGCDTHHLGAAEGKDDAQGQGEHGGQALGEPTAGLGNVVDARGVIGDVRLRDDRPDGDSHEDEDCRDLNHREPEFGLTKGLHAQHVQDEHEGQCDEGDHPLWDGLEHCPVVHVERYSGDVSHDGDGPVQEEEPAGDERALLAQELAGVGHEGARGGATHRQLAESADHQECKDATHCVGEGERGAALGQTAAGTQEQAGANRAADGDHLDMSVFQSLVIPGVSRIGRGRHLGLILVRHACTPIGVEGAIWPRADSFLQ